MDTAEKHRDHYSYEQTREANETQKEQRHSNQPWQVRSCKKK